MNKSIILPAGWSQKEDKGDFLVMRVDGLMVRAGVHVHDGKVSLVWRCETPWAWVDDSLTSGDLLSALTAFDARYPLPDWMQSKPRAAAPQNKLFPGGA